MACSVRLLQARGRLGRLGQRAPRRTKPRDAKTLDFYLDWARRGPSAAAAAAAAVAVRSSASLPQHQLLLQQQLRRRPSEQMLRRLRALASELEAQEKYDYAGAMRKVFRPGAADHQLVLDPLTGRLWIEPRMLEDARRAWDVCVRNVAVTSARGCRGALAVLERGEGMGKGVAAMDRHSPDDVD
ncbi:uncharacterized protein F4812DRAFT_57267 [Daldinia caldariorum]|uniref:uncharacterized protein n=1 Tax=Daldinia caldariorum TaxID=326644 RepID=UPI002007C68B|nr:uncharacterized protein F4812DRAFT_57267 [Daldinia caldariorum]KAI1467278.1 hypothetical protein F4812DRAFT_57267 [Daldinia caldariorum]